MRVHCHLLTVNETGASFTHFLKKNLVLILPSISPHPGLMWLVCSFWMNPEVVYNRQSYNLGKNRWSQRRTPLRGQQSASSEPHDCICIFFFTVSVHFIANCQRCRSHSSSFQRWLGNLSVLIPTKRFFISREHFGWPSLCASQLLLTPERFGYSVLYSWLSEKGKLYPLPVCQSS